MPVDFQEESKIDFQPEASTLDFQEEPIAQKATPRDPYNVIGEGYDQLLKSIRPGEFNKAFEPPKFVQKALDELIPSFIPDTPEMAQMIQMSGLEPIRQAAETVSEKTKGAIGSVLSPGGAVLAAAAPVAPELIGGLTATLSAPQVVQGVQELAKAKDLPEVAAGLGDVVLGGVGLIGGAAAAIHGIAPMTAEALRSAREVAPEIKPSPVLSEKAPETQAPTEPVVSSAKVSGVAAPETAPAIAEPTPVKGLTQPEPALAETPKPIGTEFNPSNAHEVSFTEPSFSEGPGAASPSDFPKESELKQLTGSIKQTEPVTPSLSERISQELASVKEQVQTKWEGALETLKATGQQALQSLRGDHPWTDFKDALGKFVGDKNRNDYDLIRFTQAIRKAVPDKLRREAIVNWIQADGDTTLLSNRAAASDSTRRPGYEKALDLTPDELVLAGNVRSYLDAKLQQGLDAGLLKAGVENYISQVWDRPNPVTRQLLGSITTGKLQPNFKYARQRIFESYFAGEQAGFKPKIKDVGALIAAYDQAFSRAISARNWLKAMHEGKASDGRPLVEVSGVSNPIVEGGDATALLIKPKIKPHESGDYLAVNHPAMQGWRWAGEAEDGQPVLYQGDLLVHPEVWNHVKNVLGTSRLRDYTLTRNILELQTLLKQSKLALSGFHFTQEGVHALAHRVNPLAPGKIDFTVPDQNALVDHGLQVASFHAQQAFSEGLSGHGSIYERIPVVGKWLSRYNEYLFQEYIPRLKMTMAMDALERNRQRFSGKLSDNQILELTANQSNAAFGELNYDMLGRNPTFQDAIRLAALAPDFLEARIRFAGQGFLTKTGTEQRIALALQAATMYVGARLINQYISGDPHWDKAFSIFANKREYGLRSVAGDIAHGIDDPGRFVGNRLAPLSKAIIEFATHRDMRGVKRTGFEQLADLFDWLKPITFDRRQENTAMDQIAAGSGITVKSSTATQQIYQILGKLKQDKSLLSKEEKEGLRSSSDYAQLRNALQNSNPEAAQKEYDKLLHPNDGTMSKTPQQVRSYFVHYPQSPITGSKKLEHQFVKSLSDKERELYLEARREKHDIAVKFVQMQNELKSKKR